MRVRVPVCVREKERERQRGEALHVTQAIHTKLIPFLVYFIILTLNNIQIHSVPHGVTWPYV